jgi:hypothetical protein
MSLDGVEQQQLSLFLETKINSSVWLINILTK